MGVTHCAKLIPLQYFIALQTLILLPLALIRDLAKLSTTALVADVFILTGLVYIFGTEASMIAKDGIADVKLFNPKDFGYENYTYPRVLRCEPLPAPPCSRLRGLGW
jgi:proton-coupled amino acid transporter